MALGSIVVPSMIVIIVVALIILGPKKLPEIGKAAGQTLWEFKAVAHDVLTDNPGSAEIKKEQQTTSQE